MSILVWRMWEIRPIKILARYNNVLCGFYGGLWAPGEIQHAKCGKIDFTATDATYDFHDYNSLFQYRIDYPLHPSEDTPAADCTCGIYGNKYVDDLGYNLTVPYGVAVGVAELWGKVITAELGYRAQYAKLKALVDEPELARIYGVPSLPSVEYVKREYFGIAE